MHDVGSGNLILPSGGLQVLDEAPQIGLRAYLYNNAST